MWPRWMQIQPGHFFPSLSLLFLLFVPEDFQKPSPDGLAQFPKAIMGHRPPPTNQPEAEETHRAKRECTAKPPRGRLKIAFGFFTLPCDVT